MRCLGYQGGTGSALVEFLSQTFARDRNVREKCDAVNRFPKANVKAGYAANVVGFGWTNPVFVELIHALSSDNVHHVEQAVSSPTASSL